jgi:hypothetical protein
MSINVGQVSTNLSDGERFYAYSGVIVGDVTVPASITLISIPNTGLKDAFVKIQSCYGRPISASSAHQIGIGVLIDGIEVIKSQRYEAESDYTETFELFIPRQSSLTILSLNTALNNTQERSVNMLGWRL